MTRLIILLALASLACMTAVVPSSDGHLGVKVSTEATPFDTSPKVTFENETVFVVIVDSIHIRTANSEKASSVGFVVRDDVVMGYCRQFDTDGDGVVDQAWIEYDHKSDGEPTKWIAAYFGGEWYVKGNCNG